MLEEDVDDMSGEADPNPKSCDAGQAAEAEPSPSSHDENSENYAEEQKQRALKELSTQKSIVFSKLDAERTLPENMFDKMTAEVEEKANSIFPVWMQSRPDFQIAFPRFATRENADPTTLAKISMTKSPEFRTSWDMQNLNQFVMQFPLFQNIDRELCEKVCKMFKAVDFPPGYVIFNQGDDGTTYYMVLEGTINIVKDGEIVCVIERGGAFGELAIFDSYNEATRNEGLGHRAASAVVHHSRAKVIELRAFDFREAKKQVRQSKCNKWLGFLHESCSLFKQWSRVRLYHLVQEMSSKRYSAGDVVLEAGSHTEEIYFVLTGSCAANRNVNCTLTNRWPTSKKGGYGETVTNVVKETKIADLEPGDYFGEEILFGAERLCSIKALTPVTVLCLDALSAKSILPAKTLETIQNAHGGFQATEDEVRREHTRKIKAEVEYERLRASAHGPAYRARRKKQTPKTKKSLTSSASAPALHRHKAGLAHKSHNAASSVSLHPPK